MRNRHIGVLAAIAASALAHAAPAHADFGIASFSTTFHDPAGGAVTQAGARPDVTTAFSFDTTTAPNGDVVPDEAVKEIEVDLPTGLYGDPGATPQCTAADFARHTPPLGGSCAADTQVGVATVQVSPDPAGIATLPVYNVAPAAGETAVFGIPILTHPTKVLVRVRSGSDYGLRATIVNVNQALPIYATSLTLWGVPADPVHDPERFGPGGVPAPGPSGAPRRPFLTMPARCDAALTTTARLRSWQAPRNVATASSTSPALTGCERLTFAPSISVRPSSTQADAPTGYDVELRVPQSDAVSGLGTPALRRAAVTLPAGVAISPPSAAGLQGCSDARIAPGSAQEPDCPGAATIGELSIATPALPGPLTGEVVLGAPRPGQLFRLWLVARGFGVLLKLPGTVHPDPRTGRITAVFDATPELPFSVMRLHFKGGSRAPLANPRDCGPATTATELTPYSGPVATPGDAFTVTGCGGGFAPAFTAGTTNPAGGAFSPFELTLRRPDGEQELSSLSVDLPAGLLARVGTVPLCGDAEAAAGTCGDDSVVGSALVSAGAGATPFTLPGRVHLTGPYRGAPYGLSVVVRAIAGPFDLGTVVVRAAILVDRQTAALRVVSDPFPTILEGVPLRLRLVHVAIDRPRFTFNPTSCAVKQVGAAIASVAGTVHPAVSRFQAGDCRALRLGPRLALRLRGDKETKDGGHPALTATLTQPPGQANLASAAVVLPRSIVLDPDNAQALCEADAGLRVDCPATSIVGHATAVSPALSRPIEGPIHFVKGVRRSATGGLIRTLPTLLIPLRGEVAIDLRAATSVRGGKLVTTFPAVPDAPISRFELAFDGGEHGILVANRDLCRAQQVARSTFDGHNARRARASSTIVTPCPLRVLSRRVGERRVTLRIGGLGPGVVRVAGAGLRTVTRRITRATIATIAARRMPGVRSKLRLTVSFTPRDTGVPVRRTVRLRGR
jgi:hypothetical protein